jgi:pyridoxamine 5'-phosphate oxidase
MSRDAHPAIDDPREVWHELWRELQAATRSARHPYHLGVLATSRNGWPDPRTVVLRSVDARRHELLFHTDRRSPKIQALRECDRVAWLFYDAERKIQLRITATARIYEDGPLHAERWQASRVSSRACYVHEFGPGTPLSTPLGYGPTGDQSLATLEQITPEGRHNFAVVSTTAHQVDWLSLNRRGHRRLRFKVTPMGFDSTWIAP